MDEIGEPQPQLGQVADRVGQAVEHQPGTLASSTGSTSHARRSAISFWIAPRHEVVRDRPDRPIGDHPRAAAAARVRSKSIRISRCRSAGRPLVMARGQLGDQQLRVRPQLAGVEAVEHEPPVLPRLVGHAEDPVGQVLRPPVEVGGRWRQVASDDRPSRHQIAGQLAGPDLGALLGLDRDRAQVDVGPLVQGVLDELGEVALAGPPLAVDHHDQLPRPPVQQLAQGGAHRVAIDEGTLAGQHQLRRTGRRPPPAGAECAAARGSAATAVCAGSSSSMSLLSAVGLRLQPSASRAAWPSTTRARGWYSPRPPDEVGIQRRGQCLPR